MVEIKKRRGGGAISAQNSIELILARQLASCLAMPVGIVNAEGTLVYYNEQAELVINERFDETGDMKEEVWTSFFAIEDLDRKPVPVEAWPLVVAYKEQRAVSQIVWLRCRDDAWRNISFTAFPLIGQHGRFEGAMTIFWEV